MTQLLPRWSVFVGEGAEGRKYYVPVLLHVHAPVTAPEYRTTGTGGAYIYVSGDSVSEVLQEAKRVHELRMGYRGSHRGEERTKG